ncbi:hypothetical protein MUU74_00620 [Chryseobacterium daecheongense]|uniref:hypothetical protein n=1 Tax=Chryseobacterium daecheongense TaxID=192389 RepID=UPI001FD6B452|nr:hypothetical protein [Chryseobacterium daecheongense]UOU98485.1 hypothetical protein MUU74_00620 [Chryseobacterium daecheongense]
MIQHIKTILIPILLLFLSCKQGKASEIKTEKNNITIQQPLQESKTFIFYRAFGFCDSEVGYFSEKEARDLYSDKIISINSKEGKIESVATVFDEEKINCLNKNLELKLHKQTKIQVFKTADSFPFDNLILLNNKYIVVSRDGYFFTFIIKDENVKSAAISKEIDTSSQNFNSLLNHKIVGLSIINEQMTNPYKKYGLDFSTVCYCNSPSMYIDAKSKELFIFNYCSSNNTINKIENKFTYKITKIDFVENKMIIMTSSNLKLTFQKKDKIPLFQIQIEGDFPTKYVGNDLKQIFTPEPHKFQKIDCGDFEG